MKKLITLIIFLFAAQQRALPQNIYSIVFAATSDGEIGKGCGEDINNLHLFLHRLNAALGPGFHLVEKTYNDEKFTTANFDHCLSELKTTPQDILIFYCTSHGDHNINDLNEFPQLFFPPSRSAYTFFHQLQALPHASCLAIIDACNTPRALLPGEKEQFPKGSLPAFVGQPNVPVTVTNNAHRIFVDDKFDLIITSSQVGVESVTNPDGSIFTSYLIDAFDYYLTQKDPTVVIIENVLKRANDNTLSEARWQYTNVARKNPGFKPTPQNQPQYPMWEFEPDRKAIQAKYSDRIAFTAMVESYQTPASSTIAGLLGISSVQAKSFRQATAINVKRPRRSSVWPTKRPPPDTLHQDTILPVRDLNASDFSIKFKIRKLNALQKLYYKTKNDYLVDIYIASQRKLVHLISHVHYYLDPSFKHPIVDATDKANDFKYRLFLYDTFLLRARIFLPNGSYVDISDEIPINSK